MATTVPALKGKLGAMDYYVLTIKAAELARAVQIPLESDALKWKDLSIEERYQREINYNRCKKQIAPYLANDPNRFFGAIIIAAVNFDPVFEPLPEMGKLPALYKTASAPMGFLTFKGGEILVPLDGQHRVKALKFAIEGIDEKGRKISGVKPDSKLADEDITVMMVAYDPKRARRIFNKVNRYAKSTTTGQNYIIDDDDIVAVLSREVADHIGGRLVKYSNNTLNATDPEFTTLAAVYNCNEEIILRSFPVPKIDKTKRPSLEQEELYRKKITSVWDLLIKLITPFADALADRTEAGDEKRTEIRAANLLGKPVPQMALVHAFLRLVGGETKMREEEACRRLNAIRWDIGEKIWDNILLVGTRILNKNTKLAARLAAYMAGEKLNADERKELEEDYLAQFPEDEQKAKRKSGKILPPCVK